MILVLKVVSYSVDIGCQFYRIVEKKSSYKLPQPLIVIPKTGVFYFVTGYNDTTL